MKKAASVLKFWLEKLITKNQLKNLFSHIKMANTQGTEEKEVQVNTVDLLPQKEERDSSSHLRKRVKIQFKFILGFKNNRFFQNKWKFEGF